MEKSIKISGAALESYQKLKGGGKRRTTTRKVQKGGDDVPGPELIPRNRVANVAAASAPPPVMKGGAEAVQVPPQPLPKVETLPGSNPQIAANLQVPAVNAALKAGTVPPTTQTGAGRSQQPQGKVTLVPPTNRHPKTTAGKLTLAPPSGKRRSVHTTTRKIRVQLSGLKKRITKARSIHKDSREKPISEIRTLLEEAKLIKPVKEGKQGPPDSVLRDIYKDYLLLRNKAL